MEADDLLWRPLKGKQSGLQEEEEEEKEVSVFFRTGQTGLGLMIDPEQLGRGGEGGVS